MSNPACPADEELVPMITGESADATVESHLRDCPACRRRLDVFRSDLDVLRSLPTPDQSADDDAPPRPAKIGKYLIVGELDSGGQASVYRAVHPTLDKELAIKLSRRAVGRLSDHRPLLVAEGKLLAKLDHPNLARVYDLDFHDDLPFLAMEYVRGPNLRRFAAQHPVTPRRAAEVVAEVARALAVVHRHGVTHQDVKPQNILIDETGRPRLIDFGMARLRHAWEGDESPSGGTPAFMAPEQGRGESAVVGPRSDVFALGGVLYFLLTGRVPFLADDVPGTLALVRRCEFDRSALDKPGVPRRLRQICLKAMAADPADRYPTADAFAAALDRHLTLPRRLARTAGATVAAVLLVGLGIGIWSVSRPNRDAATNTLPPGPDPTTPLMANPNPAAPAPTFFEVKVSRGGGLADLTAAVPLNPDADRYQVIGRVPPGHHALLLHVTTDSKVEKLTTRPSPADRYTTHYYPADGTTRPFDPSGPGTEVLLLFAAAEAKDLDDLIDDAKEFLTGLPPMGPKEFVRFSRDEPVRGIGFDPADGSAQVQYKLDLLRQHVRGKKLSVIQGVAYAR